eukprot:2828018-Pyramimonas_sp.AAC.1
MDDEDEQGDRMVRRGLVPSISPDRARARSSGARSSGVQRPHPPEAGTSSGPPGKAPSAHAPPREGTPDGKPASRRSTPRRRISRTPMT